MFPRGFRFRMSAQVVAGMVMLLASVLCIVWVGGGIGVFLGLFGAYFVATDMRALYYEAQALQQQSDEIYRLTGRRV